MIIIRIIPWFSLISAVEEREKIESEKLVEGFLTRRLSGFEILNNATLIFQKWLVSRHFAIIFHYLNFSEEYL